MAIFAYVKKDKDLQIAQKQLNIVQSETHDFLYVDSASIVSDAIELEDLLKQMKKGDTLLLYNLKSLRKSVVQLAPFLQELEEDGKFIISLEEKIDTANRLGADYLDIIYCLSEMERELIKERTLKGLNKAKKEGRYGGRPSISEEKIKLIRNLYFQKSNSIREIANRTGISVGSIHKYISQIPE